MKARLLVVHVCAVLLVGVCVHSAISTANASPATSPSAQSPQTPSVTTTVYLPLVVKPESCDIVGESYNTLSVNPPKTDRPAEQHADLNLGLRGYTPTTAVLGLIDINGSYDPDAPQFPGLFVDTRTPTFTSAYQVYNWSFAPPPNPGTRTTPIPNPPVTLLGMGTTVGEIIRVPNSNYNIDNGFQVLVLYAAPTRITLKYTRDDNVISGYTIHIENVCVEPNLLALYQQWNTAGRSQLPALRGLQPFGRALGSEIEVSIQDNGTWLDPRSRKDWWQGR